MLTFHKYHALGNDYLVLDPADALVMQSPQWIERVCHRNFGLGSDGILHGPLPSTTADFGLRIYNPDGSEAEKSGNGLRIFARYLFDLGVVTDKPFTVETPGGVVMCTVAESGKRITVEMGTVSFVSSKIPVTGPEREVINETIQLDGKDYTFCAATIGNPHCVVPVENPTSELARKLGPQIERNERFPKRINVQFLKVIDRNNIAIEIWERGAGYTLASGSSSSAAGAVARKLGLVDADITVHMPGGIIQLHITDDYAVTMTGPTTAVGKMGLHPQAAAGIK